MAAYIGNNELIELFQVWVIFENGRAVGEYNVSPKWLANFSLLQCLLNLLNRVLVAPILVDHEGDVCFPADLDHLAGRLQVGSHRFLADYRDFVLSREVNQVAV